MSIRADLFVEHGTDFETTLSLFDDNGDPVDITNVSAHASFRKHFLSSNAHSFTTNLDANNGVLTIRLAANTTMNLTPGRYVWDCVLVKNTVKTKICDGILTLNPTSTRVV